VGSEADEWPFISSLIEEPLPQYEPPGTIDEQFEKFHAANPHVYARVLEIALYLRQLGFKKCGISLIFERMRWTESIKTKDDRGFKLQNNFRACYARLAMREYEELFGFFRLRRRRSESPQQFSEFDDNDDDG